MAQQQNHTSVPFWDFIQSLDPNQATGRGVDHQDAQSFPQFPAGFPFGAPGPHHPSGPHVSGPWAAGFEGNPWQRGHGPWGRHGHRGRHTRGGPNEEEQRGDEAFTSASDAERDAEKEKGDSPDTLRGDAPDPAEVAPEDDDEKPHGRCGRGRSRRGPGHCGRGGFGGFRRGGPRWGPHHGAGFFPGPPPYSGQGAPFDFAGMMRGLSNHPFFQNLRNQAENFRTGQNPQSGNNNTDSDAFVPPVDIFNTETAFILHVALPGAKKDDIGVNWDPDNSVLNIAGVVYRPGDEEFLQTLSAGERRIGLFERNITLPPAGAATEREEIDGFSISAKMEDGVLIVTVPKVEKEWTEIHKVDIE